MQEDHANDKVNKIRPPELWNHPELPVNHNFRSISDPKGCYIDGRIERFEDKVNYLAENLATINKLYWDELVSRVINVFIGYYNT